MICYALGFFPSFPHSFHFPSMGVSPLQSSSLLQTSIPLTLPSSSSSSSSSYATLSPLLLLPHPRRSSSELDHNFLSISVNIPPPSKQALLVTRCSCRSETNCKPEPGILHSVFGGIGIEEAALQVFDKNPTSLESIRTRIKSLRSIGIDGFALGRLIDKRPDVLTAPEIDQFISFIRHEDDLRKARKGDEINPEKLARFLSSTDHKFLAEFAQRIRLLIHHGIPPNKLIYVLNNVNFAKVFSYKSYQELERTILFLKRLGGGVEFIVRCPRLLNFPLDEQLMPRVQILTDLNGGDENATGLVLRKLPAVLFYSIAHLQNHIEFMKSFAGLSDQEVFKIVLGYPNIFSASIERKLRPRIEFLQHCGLTSNDISKFLIKAPLFIGLSFEDNLSVKLGFLVKVGYKNKTKEIAIALGAVTRTSCQNLQKVIGVFLTFGLLPEDILAMSIKHPQILQYNHKSSEMKMDYLIGEIGRDIEELLNFPAFLGYNLDDRIKHRYEVKRETIGEGMSLNKLLNVSTETFSKRKRKPSEYVDQA